MIIDFEDYIFPSTEVWLVGKGPSIENYNWPDKGLIICLNQSFIMVPKCQGVIGLDYEVLDYYKKYLNPSIMVFRKKSHDRYNFENMVLWAKNPIIQTLYSTSTVAVELCYYFKARLIHMVGFDSINGNFNRPSKIVEASGQGDTSRYNNINERLLATIARFDDLTVTWEHRN